MPRCLCFIVALLYPPTLTLPLTEGREGWGDVFNNFLERLGYPSIKRIVKILAVRLAAAFLVPRPRAFLDEFDPDFPFFFGYGAGEVHGLFSGKVVPPFGDSKHGALRAQEIRIGNLISHDAPGYRGDGLFMLKRS